MPVTQIQSGILNLPGSSPQSAETLVKLLKEDSEQHHCLCNPIGLHNHLAHHLVAAYDLGASPALLKAIYDDEKRIQRPIDPNGLASGLEGLPAKGDVNISNWTKWLGNEKVYSAYLSFFNDIVAQKGIPAAVQEFLFSREANEGEVKMLTRSMNLLFHPMIQIACGTELMNPTLVAEGLAQCSIHAAGLMAPDLMSGSNAYDPSRIPPPTRSEGLSLLSVLREIYDSPILKPIMPYDGRHDYPNRIFKLLSGERGPEMQRIINRWFIDVDNVETNVEECLWVMTLILFATGKRDRQPRLDFFTMHYLTSSLFLPSMIKVLHDPQHIIDLLRMWLYVTGLFLIDRGRPRIDPELLMTYTTSPRPPAESKLVPHSRSLGDPKSESPWPAMLASVIHAPDAHTLKTFRSLYYAAQKYGRTPAGHVPGSIDPKSGKETHVGISKADGTIFVRAAGVLMDYMGWVTYGQQDGVWDRCGLGWTEAWDIPDEENLRHWRIVDYGSLEEHRKGQNSA